jgi:hypothetical protein
MPCRPVATLSTVPEQVFHARGSVTRRGVPRTFQHLYPLTGNLVTEWGSPASKTLNALVTLPLLRSVDSLRGRAVADLPDLADPRIGMRSKVIECL